MDAAGVLHQQKTLEARYTGFYNKFKETGLITAADEDSENLENLVWEYEKEELGLPPHLQKEKCINGSVEAMKYEFVVDPFIEE